MRNKKNVSERRDKTYLRNELKLTYHYILSYIHNTFIVRHYKRRIYFRNIKRTDSCDCLQRNAKGTHLNSRWAYKRGGLSSGWAYIRNNIYSRWQMDGLISGGGFKVGFYGTTYRYGSDRISHTITEWPLCLQIAARLKLLSEPVLKTFSLTPKYLPLERDTTKKEC